MNIIGKIIITGAFIALSSNPAMAATDAPRTTEVKHADLDLSSEEGQKTLELRINRAAKAVCESGGEYLNVALRSRVNACIAQTTAEAQKSIAAKTQQSIKVAAKN